MIKLKALLKKFIVYNLCLVTLFVSLSNPLIVSAAMPAPSPTLNAVDGQFGVLESFGYLIMLSTGIDMTMSDGNPFTKHDVALMGYDFLKSYGFSGTAFKSICKLWFMDSSWSEPQSLNNLDFGTLNSLTRDDIINYAYDDKLTGLYLELLPESKNIFDKLGDFVSSVLDGTNTIQIGGKPITAENVKGFNGTYRSNADGKLLYNCTATGWVKGSYSGEYLHDFYFEAETALINKCAAYYDTNKNTIYTYQEASNDVGYNAVGFVWVKRPSDGGTGSYVGSAGRPVTALSSIKPFVSFGYDMPIFDSIAALENYFATGVYSGAINKAQQKFDYHSLSSSVIAKLFPFVSGAAVSVKSLYDAYTKTKNDVKVGSITDTPAYVDAMTNVIKGLQTIDKALTEDKPILPPAGADILEWIKTIASCVVVIPTELRKISLVALESTVGAIADGFPAIRQDLKTITDIFPAIRQDVKTITDIFPAMRLDTKTIADGFPALRQALESIGDTFPAITNSLDTIIDVFPSFVDFQLQVLPRLKDMADALTRHSGQFADMSDTFRDGFLDLSGKLGSMLDSLNIPLGGILDIPLSDVAAKVDGITDALTGLGDLSLSIPDYSGFLKTIIGLLQQILAAILSLADFFTLDGNAVLLALSDAVADFKYHTGLEPLLDFFKRLNFTDNYEYLKVTVKTPFFMSAYYDKPDIVLFDASAYAVQFSYVRILIRISLWITFAIAQFKQISVSFHVG